MKQEGRLWQAVKLHMWLPGDRFNRVENGFGEGLPDVNACLRGEDVWIELKAPQEPKRATTKLMTSNSNHALLPSQINWCIAQRQAGGISFILVRTNKRIILVEGTRHAEEFNDMTVSSMCDISLLHYPCPISKENWRMLRNVIFTASRHHRVDQYTQDKQLLNGLERKGLAGHRITR